MLRFIYIICKFTFVGLVWLIIILSILFFYYYKDLPSLKDVENNNSKQIIEILYSNGNQLATLGDIYNNQIIFGELPANLIDAVIATEDRRFFDHSGIDIFGILRAAYENYKANKIVQGGSTITQQLVKLMFLSPKKTFKRKIQEVILAWQIEKTFSKEQILTLYLNRAYFGAGQYGVANAAKFYFGKDISKINLNEAAMLAGLLKAPSRLSPINNKELAQERTNQVLSNMINAGYLNENNFDKIITEEINYSDGNLQKMYFADYSANIFDEYINNEQQESNNRFIITTTLNENLQKIIERETNNFIKTYQNKLQNTDIALILMNKDGEILSMIGGKDYQKSQFNKAIYAKRQAGSAFKIFIYLTAIQSGYKIDDVFVDEPVILGNWLPKNYDNKYYGEVSLNDAFANSLNSVAVKLVSKLDKQKIISNAVKMGISSNISKNDATIALGTVEVSLLEMVNSYSSIANNGFAVLPSAIRKISANNNGVIYQRSPPNPYKIIDDQTILSMKEILRNVVANGTGKRANVNINIYGKTGTTQNYRDAWFIGFNDNYILGIWMGSEGKVKEKITGGSLPAELFARIIKKIDFY